MKICYVNRNREANSPSIEAAFDSISHILAKRNVIFKHYVPDKYANPNAIIANLNSFKSSDFKEYNIFHVTGDVHYMVLRCPHKNVVLTIHDLMVLEYENNPIKWIIKYIIWYFLPTIWSGNIVVISSFTAKNLINICPWTKKKLRIINGPIDDAFSFTPKEFNENAPVIIVVGTSERKNVKRLILAVKGIRCKLLIVGKLSEELIIMLQNNSVKYDNYYNIEKDKLVEKYKECDICYFASLYEGLGIVPIEAQAIGRCVISSNIEPHLSVAGEAAVFVNPYSVEEIREAILNIIANKDLRVKLVESGLNNVKRFRLEKVTREYEKLYQEIVNIT